jgi:hypothetical protein
MGEAILCASLFLVMVISWVVIPSADASASSPSVE